MKKPTKILICSHIWTVGGVESHIIRLIRLLVSRGAEVLFATRNSFEEVPVLQTLREIPVKCLRTPFANRGGRASTLWSIVAWQAQLRDKVDVLYTFDTTWFAVFLSRFVKPGGYVIGTHAGPPHLEEEYVHSATRQILNGFLVEAASQIDGYSSLAIPIRAIPHLANVRGAGPRRQREIDTLRVAFMGRLDANKGMHRLVDLWRTLQIQPATLDIYGDGRERAGLEKKIRNWDLEQDIRLRGAWRPEELPAIMDQADLVVLPSEYEGLPLVLLECMAFGVPFVASDVGAVRSLAEDNPDVRVVPLENSAIAAAIQEVAAGIRNGGIRGDRLQEYYSARYGHEHLADHWVSALMNPEEFWGAKRSTNRVSLPQLMLARMKCAKTLNS
jgi:glycosyltransferase involved in cell wall biosynthesis